MPSIIFLKTLSRDTATIDSIRSALEDAEIVYLSTTRTCARWLETEMDQQGINGYSFPHNREWRELLVNHAELGGSLQDLNEPIGHAIDRWEALDEPDRHTMLLSL